mgnify:FL=1
MEGLAHRQDAKLDRVTNHGRPFFGFNKKHIIKVVTYV